MSYGWPPTYAVLEQDADVGDEHEEGIERAADLRLGYLAQVDGHHCVRAAAPYAAQKPRTSENITAFSIKKRYSIEKYLFYWQKFEMA